MSVCKSCNGTGSTCANCAKPSDECQCSEYDQELHDCQSCQGDSEDEYVIVSFPGFEGMDEDEDEE